MNKEYIEKDDKVYVATDEGKLEIRNLAGATKEILEKENDYEIVSNEINKSNKRISNLIENKKYKSKQLKTTLLMPFVVGPIATLLGYIMTGFDSINNFGTSNMIFVPELVFGISFGMAGLFSTIPIIEKKDIKKELRETVIKNEKLKELGKKLEKELNDIKEREKEIKNANDNQEIIHRLSDNINDYVNLIGFYAEYFDEIKKEYNHDNLTNYLKEYTSNEDYINYVNNMIKEDVNNKKYVDDKKTRFTLRKTTKTTK